MEVHADAPIVDLTMGKSPRLLNDRSGIMTETDGLEDSTGPSDIERACNFISATEQLLADGEFDTVFDSIGDMNPYAYDSAQMHQLLGLMQSCRQFRSLEKAAGIFAMCCKTDMSVRRRWALALIEQGRLSQAVTVAGHSIPNIAKSDVEYSEMLGVLGRGHKQRYVQTGNICDLQEAVAAYELGWSADVGDQDWHGINLVALLSRAKRDAIDIKSDQVAAQVAESIIAGVEANAAPQPWDLANAMEASLLVGSPEQILGWARAYVSHAETDAFAIGGTLRQLREVWAIDATSMGRTLKPILEYELLRRRGGAIDVAPDDPSPDTSGFEAVYGSESYTHVQWLENVFSILSSVARIRDRLTGQPVGTGFLIDGKTIDDSMAGKSLLVTNSHVVSDDPSDRAAVLPDEAVAEFTRISGQPKYRLGAKCRHSRRNDLDYWICEIDVDDRCAALPVSSKRPPVPGDAARNERVFVVGHPQGGDLVVSMFNNDLLGYDGPFVHYNSPTEGGSSGSPVLSRDLRIFALHHRTRRDIKANEGVLFEHIIGASLQ